jgi:hypothetical protein
MTGVGTSEFGNEFGMKVISGTIFEDIAGNALAGGETVGDTNNVGVGGVTLYVYRDGGDATADGVDDVLIGTTTTLGDGSYSFAGDNASYWVVVDSTTIAASVGLNATYSQTDTWADQTYGVAGALAANGAGGTSILGSTGTAFGGRLGDVSDDASTLGSSEHVTAVSVSGSNVSGIDSGFSFNVVTGVRDGDDVGSEGRSIQGSFRQFVNNSNAIVGSNAMRFVPVVATNDTDGGGNAWWTITLTSSLDQIRDDATTIDGTAYDFSDGVTVLDSNAGQIGSGGTVGLGSDGVLGTGDDVTIGQFDRTELELVGVANDTYVIYNHNDAFALQDIAIRKAADGTTNAGIVMLSGTNEVLQNSLLGVSADGTTHAATGPGGSFVYLQASNGTVRNNYFGYGGSGDISALSSSHADSATLIGNEVDGGFQFGFSAYGDNMVVSGNLIEDITAGFAIGVFYQNYTGVLIENNTVRNTTGYSAIPLASDRPTRQFVTTLFRTTITESMFITTARSTTTD